MLLIRGEYEDICNRLFQVGTDGRMMFGPAFSKESNANLGHLSDWTEFTDYIMEGFISYFLRVRKSSDGLVLDIKLTGSNRDRYVSPSVKAYIRWAGLEWTLLQAEE